MATLAPPAHANVIRDDSRGSKRLYRIEFTAPDGQRLPVEDYWSATTLLKGLPKDALVRWAANETAAAALTNLTYWQDTLEQLGLDETARILAGSPWRKSGRKADVGSTVHAQIEARIKGETPPPIPPDEAPQVNQYLARYSEFLDAHRPEWEASELTVCHTEHRFAGTLDAIGVVGGRRLLIDVKTTKAGRNGDPGVYLEAAAQIAAYRHAELAIDVRTGGVFPMPQTDGGAVLWLHPDRYALVEVKCDAQMYRLFRLAAEIWVATDTARTGWYLLGEIEP